MMPKIRFLFAGAALILFMSACATTGRDPLDRITAEQAQQMGEKYLAAGDLAQALRFLTLAHEKNPNDPMILYELGLAYDERGLPDKALEYYQNALKIKPDYSDVHNALGRLYASRGQLDKAQAAFEAAFKNPFYGLPQISLYNLGLVHEKKHDYETALKYYQDATRLQPSYGLAHYRTGLAMEALRRTDEARRAYGKAIQYNPDMAEAHVRYGVLSYNAGDLQNAMYSLNRVVKLAPHTEMEEEAKRYLTKLKGVVGPGPSKGGLIIPPPEKLGEMEVVARQDLVYKGRGVITTPEENMAPAPRVESPPVAEVRPSSPKKEATPAPESIPVTVAPKAPPALEDKAPPPPVEAPSPSNKSVEGFARESPLTRDMPPAVPVDQAPSTIESAGEAPLSKTASESKPDEPPSSSDKNSKVASKPPSGRARWAYIVQIGSFLEKGNAEQVKKKLQKKGYSAVVKPFNHPVKGEIYVVQLDPVQDSTEAGSLLTRIEGEEKLKPLIIKVPASD